MATAFTLARILSNIPLSRGGPASVVIFDIHALQVILVMLSPYTDFVISLLMVVMITLK